MSDEARGRSAGSRRTRQRIVDAARRSFATRGLVPVSLRDIAGAAGVSHPGLLRHFASKPMLIDAVMEQLDDEVGTALDGLSESGATMPAVARATSNVASFDALASMLEAADGFTEAHARLLRRYADIRRRVVGHEALHSALAIDRSMVLWSGLRLLAQYLPGEVDPAAQLGDADEARTVLRSGGDRLAILTLADIVDKDTMAYASGKRRREEILHDATIRFARYGYHGTSLRDIAESVGVSSSTLLYHFGSKEELLTAVLRRRDELLAERARTGATPREELAFVGLDARLDAQEEPGLIELHARVASEAVVPEHPAHGYLAERYRRTIAYFTRLVEVVDGNRQDASPLSPSSRAIRLVALWEGLQIHALADGIFGHIGNVLDLELEELLCRGAKASE